MEFLESSSSLLSSFVAEDPASPSQEIENFGNGERDPRSAIEARDGGWKIGRVDASIEESVEDAAVAKHVPEPVPDDEVVETL